MSNESEEGREQQYIRTLFSITVTTTLNGMLEEEKQNSNDVERELRPYSTEQWKKDT